jgi:hypothetical protein
MPRKCPQGHAVCPVFVTFKGTGHANMYECVDIQNDLESCGGRVKGDSHNGEMDLSGGRDCSAIPDVGSARCAKGAWVVGKDLCITCGVKWLVDGSPQSDANAATLLQKTG